MLVRLSCVQLKKLFLMNEIKFFFFIFGVPVLLVVVQRQVSTRVVYVMYVCMYVVQYTFFITTLHCIPGKLPHNPVRHISPRCFTWSNDFHHLCPVQSKIPSDWIIHLQSWQLTFGQFVSGQ